MLNANLGKKLYRIRINEELTLQEVAEHINVDVSIIERLETGDTSLPIEVLTQALITYGFLEEEENIIPNARGKKANAIFIKNVIESNKKIEATMQAEADKINKQLGLGGYLNEKSRN